MASPGAGDAKDDEENEEEDEDVSLPPFVFKVGNSKFSCARALFARSGPDKDPQLDLRRCPTTKEDFG